ncbi:MAG: hypothetical protein EXQ63_06095 [Ilumatobacteraceae bacterium]|nr:hypothetical protein [Ilumatobacteraceae bacterium]
MSDLEEVSVLEGACLALVENGATHGYEIAQHFDLSTKLGAIYSVSRPVVYRTLDGLVKKKYLSSADSTGARGQLKMILKLTKAGDQIRRDWLNRPVQHIREIRTELLVKLLLRHESGLAPQRFLTQQRSVLQVVLTGLLQDREDSAVAVWRREQARAVVRFLDELLGQGHDTVLDADSSDRLQLSARNQLRATVIQVKHGGVLSSVKLAVSAGQKMTATITQEATHQLMLAPGDEVLALCKATDVLVAIQPH